MSFVGLDWQPALKSIFISFGCILCLMLVHLIRAEIDFFDIQLANVCNDTGEKDKHKAGWLNMSGFWNKSKCKRGIL